MASLSIAKATLLASCLRRDDKLESISRDALTEFHDLLEKTISHCNNLNVQKTKIWLIKHILPSSPRTLALSKYFRSLSKNIRSVNPDSTTLRPWRQQLHLAYILHDTMHHAQYHSEDSTLRRHIQEHIPPMLTQIFSDAATDKRSRTVKRLQNLLDTWQKERMCRKEFLTDLQQILVLDKSNRAKSEERENVKETPKDSPWVMPATHGDPKAPYFDLPAANLMPHVVPNSSRPIRSDQVKALHLTPGPADETLVNALKDFLKDVKSIDDPYNTLEDEGIIPDMDEVGQISYANEVNDSVIETYYGWSRAFCEKMKSRDKDNQASRSNRSLSRSRSYSRSRSGSRSPINGHDHRVKRRRYSRSRSSSASDSHNRNQARPPSYPSLRGHDSQWVSQSQPLSPALPPQFRSMEQTRPQIPPPPPATTNFETRPFSMPQVKQIPPRPPKWPDNVPWPPPPPPPPLHNVNFNAYGNR